MMTTRGLFIATLLIFCGYSSSVRAQDTASLTGVVTDSENGNPLFGASVLLSVPGGAVVQGVVADVDGRFQITDVAPGEYRLEVHYIAYVGFSLDVSLAAGEVRTVNALLTTESININTIVVTASRGQEKVLDSPASITVIEAQEVEQDVGFSTIGTLRNVTGVDLAQTSIDRSQISLRGFNAANINGNVFLLNDYRPALGSEGVAFYSIMSSTSVDLDRIEVVRGPASALYGAGGDAGVVHFITKNPFDYPGTTVALSGGERGMFAGQYRHAGIIRDRVGYKITATYKQAEEWTYDPDDPIDAPFLSQEIIQRIPDYSKTVLDGMMQYRLADGVSITANGGFSELSGFLLTDLAPFQVNKMLGYYGQLRLQAGNFFAQMYANMRDAGESFAYTALRPIVQEGGRYGGQMQFEHNSSNSKTRLIAGLDADLIRLESSGTLTGRNEFSDDITLLGGYVQSTLDVSDAMDVIVAMRGDWSNVFDGLQLSPRAAILYKPSQLHTLRASYNSAFAAPTTFQFFLDFVLQEQLLNQNGAQFLVMGRGGAEAYSFDNFRANPSARLFLPVEGFLGGDFGMDSMPIAPIFGAAAGGGLVDLLRSSESIPGLELSPEQRNLFADLLALTAATGFTGQEVTDAGVLGLPDAGERGFKEVAAPVDTRRLDQTTTQTLELGYKGVLWEGFLLNVDVYYANKKNFVGPLSLITPFVYLDSDELTGDIAASLTDILGATDDPDITALLEGLEASGLSQAQVSGMLAGMVGQAMANQSIGVVQTDQDILQPGTTNAVGALTAFQNFGDIDYWGTDISLEVYTGSAFSFFGNVSVVSDDLFDSNELGEDDPNLELALNAPAFKAKLGLGYDLGQGLTFTAFGRYNKSYPVRSGRLLGTVESAALLDLGASYSFSDSFAGLRFDLMVQNVLDRRHRYFIGAPRIGRMAMARLTYTFE